MHEDANPKPAPPSDKEPLSHTLYRRFGRICRIVGSISLVLYGVAVARSIATREGSLSFSVLFHGDHVGLLCLFILAMVPSLHFRFLYSAGIIASLEPPANGSDS